MTNTLKWSVGFLVLGSLAVGVAASGRSDEEPAILIDSRVTEPAAPSPMEEPAPALEVCRESQPLVELPGETAPAVALPVPETPGAPARPAYDPRHAQLEQTASLANMKDWVTDDASPPFEETVVSMLSGQPSIDPLLRHVVKVLEAAWKVKGSWIDTGTQTRAFIAYPTDCATSAVAVGTVKWLAGREMGSWVHFSPYISPSLTQIDPAVDNARLVIEMSRDPGNAEVLVATFKLEPNVTAEHANRVHDHFRRGLFGRWVRARVGGPRPGLEVLAYSGGASSGHEQSLNSETERNIRTIFRRLEQLLHP